MYNNDTSVGNLRGTRNQVGIVLLYRPSSLCSFATQFQTRFLESIPRPISGTEVFDSGPPAYAAWLLNSRLGSWNRFLAPKGDLSFRLRLLLTSLIYIFCIKMHACHCSHRHVMFRHELRKTNSPAGIDGRIPHVATTGLPQRQDNGK